MRFGPAACTSRTDPRSRPAAASRVTQNTQICTASVLTGIQLTATQIGGDARRRTRTPITRRETRRDVLAACCRRLGAAGWADAEALGCLEAWSCTVPPRLSLRGGDHWV